MSEGNAFTASLRHNGRKVGTIEDEGRGGVPMIIWAPGAADHREAWNRWVADYQALYPEDAKFEPEYAAIVALVDEWIVAALLRRVARRETPVLKPGQDVRDPSGFTSLNRTVTDPAFHASISQFADRFDRYWDGKSWVRL